MSYPDEIVFCEDCGGQTSLGEAHTKTVSTGPGGEMGLLVFCPDCTSD